MSKKCHPHSFDPKCALCILYQENSAYRSHIDYGVSVQPVIEKRHDRCRFLGKRIENRSGCLSGMRCRHDCQKGLPAIPAGYCQRCVEYVAVDRNDPIYPEAWTDLNEESVLTAGGDKKPGLAPSGFAEGVVTIPALGGERPIGRGAEGLGSVQLEKEHAPSENQEYPQNGTDDPKLEVSHGNNPLRPYSYDNSSNLEVNRKSSTITYKTIDVKNPTKDVNPTIIWQYGITTVPTRRNNLFIRTYRSLVTAGFDSPHLFIDGDADGSSWIKQLRDEYGLSFPSITLRETNARTAGHWVLSLYEIWCRNPHADRYAIFQDDFVTYPHLKEYLESCPYPNDRYWNLYTFPWNEPGALSAKNRNSSSVPDSYKGWYQSDQRGTGAVALVFDHSTVRQLLSSAYLVDRFMDKKRGHRAIDGGIVSALKEVGRREYVHTPSLVQHTGDVSSMGNGRHSKSVTFRGEAFDAREMIIRT